MQLQRQLNIKKNAPEEGIGNGLESCGACGDVGVGILKFVGALLKISLFGEF
jgi:hypothetical protein